MNKCPFELPVKPEMMRYRETDLELYRIHKLVFPYTKEEVDFICQTINNYEKFINMLILSESILGGHISHHIKNNSPLCDKCKINIRDAVSRITKTLAEAKKE